MTYRGKKIAILGLARSGMAAAKLLLMAGADVYVSDAADNAILRDRAKELKRLGAKVELGGHNGSMKDAFDEVVLSPGVPTDIPLLLWYKSNNPNMPIISEIELAYRFAKGSIIGITGSNGKSTTVSMTGALFAEAGFDTEVVGNIGKPMSEIVMQTSDKHILCVELSSFQLEMIDKFRAKAACLLNLTPDHLDRHYTQESYFAAKARIFENQTDGDFAILNYDDKNVKSLAENIKSQILWFSNGEHPEAGVFVRNGIICSRGIDGVEEEIMPTDQLKLPGGHNLANACAAIACTLPFEIQSKFIAEGFSKFAGLPHRLENIGAINGVRFINDSKATNVDSLECALRSFEEKVVLIAGGYDKGADFSPIKNLVAERVKHAVLIGATADRIDSDWNNSVQKEHADSLEDAVSKAFQAAKPNGIVLLAPGCASYDMFDNFEHRGDIFAEIVKNLIKRKK